MTDSPRSLYTVIENMIKVIPDDKPKIKEQLAHYLANKLLHLAPELLISSYEYSRFVGWMKNNLPDPTENDWMKPMVNAFNGKYL